MALRNFILGFLLTLGPQVLNGMPREPSQHHRMDIINGRNASVGEFPFMAAIYYKGYFTCGGTILSEEWILTAAHCVYDQANTKRDSTQFSVITGSDDLLDPDAETDVSQIIVHEAYKYTDNQPNDIALFKLSEPLEFDATTQPVTLSSADTDPPANYPITVTGWGVNKYRGNPVRFLQKATVNVYSNTDCKASYAPYINILPSNICAGTPSGGVGQCTGDSGGPVVVEGKTSYQVGIISFSAKPCGIKGYPGVNTRVSQYLSWIQKNTGL